MTQQQRGFFAIALALLLIAIVTLSPQQGVDARPFDPCISCGTFGSTNFLLNAILFLPLGAGLMWRGVSFARALLVCLATTVAVETLQLLLIAGRSATLGDIISNAGGGAVGWAIAANLRQLSLPGKQQGLVLSSLQATAMVAVAIAGAWLFQSAPTDQPFYGQIAPPFHERGAVDGIVSSASLNGAPFPDALFPAAAEKATRERMGRNEISLHAKFVLRSEKTRQVYIVRIADAVEEEIALLGAHGHDAIFAVRTRATDMALFQPSLRIPGAFACDSCADGFAHGWLTVSGARNGSRYDLAVSGNGPDQRTEIVLSANMVWLVLTPEISGSVEETRALTTLWLLAQSLWLAYWLAFTSWGSRSLWFVLGCSAAVGIITQAAVPAIARTAFGTPLEWAAILTGTVLGGIVAGRFRSRESPPREA